MRVIGDEFVGRPGVAGWDPMRLVIDVRGTGCTGYEVAAALRGGYDIHVELATHATLVLILGLGAAARGPRALRPRLRRGGAPDRAPGRRGRARARAAARWRTRWSSRRARRSSATPRRSRSTTPSAASRPRRSRAIRPASRRCCPASGSPTELVAYLRELKASGARLHGASDPDFRTICVLRVP